MRGALSLAALAALIAAPGCARRPFYEWRDEPYLRPCYEAGEAEAMRRTRSRFADEREIGYRTLSVIAREALRAGEKEKAAEIARFLMTACEGEPDPNTRSTILAVCLRAAGRGNEKVHEFLKARLAGGEAASAAYALAALRIPGSYERIAQVYAEADFELRYEILGALWLLGDARAVPVFARALKEIDEKWPERIHHMPKDMYRKALAGRLETLKAAARSTGR